jgi:adenosine deaminase
MKSIPCASSSSGEPVALCSDVPVQIATTIGREYALAHALGFSLAELVGFTTNAIHASFTPPERKAALLMDLAGGGSRDGCAGG